MKFVRLLWLYVKFCAAGFLQQPCLGIVSSQGHSTGSQVPKRCDHRPWSICIHKVLEMIWFVILSSVKVVKFQFTSLQTSIIQESIKWYTSLKNNNKNRNDHMGIHLLQKCITLNFKKRKSTQCTIFSYLYCSHKDWHNLQMTSSGIVP